MKCLVTGAAGYIGSNLTKRLISEGHYVTGLVHVKKPPSYLHDKRLDYVTGDITDRESLLPVVKEVDVVFHCAALVKDFGPKKVFNQVNYGGTKNLVEVCENLPITRFIFLGRISQQKNTGYYSKSKALAERYLQEKYKRDNFPGVIIRPGNVYGPGATIWVLRILQAIKANRIALIDRGRGIFLHTYIDNLLDALISAMTEPRADGEILEVTDGDNCTTWGEYLNSLSIMIGKKTIKRTMSKTSALLLSRIQMLTYRFCKTRPIVTPLAVDIFTNRQRVSIEKAKDILQYQPQVDFEEGIKRVEQWLRNEGYIP